MKKYKQLTQSERYHIRDLKNKEYSIRKIAKFLCRSPSTISRELKRNSGGKGYRHQQAQARADKRHKDKAKKIKIDDKLQRLIISGLQNEWSPDNICGRMKLDLDIELHHESVYRFIYRDLCIKNIVPFLNSNILKKTYKL